jgi:mevalonate kinase
MSGAGGGDYVIGCSYSLEKRADLINAWRHAGFVAIPLIADTMGTIHREII